MKTPKINTLQLSFNLPIHAFQIPQWRGAFIEMAGWEHHFFHNHKSGREYYYRYPLIHYRKWNDKAAIFAINEGVEAFQKVIAKSDWEIKWEGSKRSLHVEDLRVNTDSLNMLTRPKTYKLFKWLALNQENYERWQQEKSLVKRAALLENILAGQILGFCTAMGWRLPERLEVNLHDIQFMKKVRLHGNPMIAFNITYDANVLLPSGMALGRGVSTGFGWQVPARIGPKPGNWNASSAKEQEEAQAK